MKNFKSKLHLACSKDELRPVMNYVHFSDGYAYATNGHVLVRHKLEDHDFTEEEISMMNGKCLHWKAFRQILSYNHVEFDKDHGFVCKDGYKSIFAYGSYLELDFKVIQFEEVIDDLLNKPVMGLSTIGLDFRNSNLIRSCMVRPNDGVKMEFRGSNKGIVIRPNNIEYGSELYILMPMIIN